MTRAWVADQEGALDSSYGLRAHRRFSVQFLVESASLEAAQEDCLRVIRSAWKQAGIEARAGDDWDGSSLEVTPAAGG